MLRTSAAVLAIVWLGHAAMAQDAEVDETVVADQVWDDGGWQLTDPPEPIDDGSWQLTDPPEPIDDDGVVVVEDDEIIFEILPYEGDDGGVVVEDGVPTDEEVVFEEGYVGEDGNVEEEIILSDGIGDGEPLDPEVYYVEGEEDPVADGSGEEEPVFVTSCGGCELESGVGGPEVQRDNTPGGVIAGGSDDRDAPVARSSSNACDSGPVSKMWICTVQNGAWRD